MTDRTFQYQKLVDTNPNMLVPWYLMASYLYYIKDESLLSDAFYDEICKRLAVLYDNITHVHKHLIDKNQLSAGTGYYLSEECYPNMVKCAALSLIEGD